MSRSPRRSPRAIRSRSSPTRGELHPVMPGLIGYPKMYLHQQEVFEAVREKHHVLVSTGTGSGKTEAFLYPIVDELLRERDQGITSGLSAILVYPDERPGERPVGSAAGNARRHGHHLRSVGRPHARHRSQGDHRPLREQQPGSVPLGPPATAQGGPA